MIYMLIYIYKGELPWKERFQNALSMDETRDLKNKLKPE